MNPSTFSAKNKSSNHLSTSDDGFRRSIEALYADQQRKAVLIEQECIQLDVDIARYKQSSATMLKLLETEKERQGNLQKQRLQLEEQREHAEKLCKQVNATVHTVENMTKQILENDQAADAEVARQNIAVAEAEQRLEELRVTNKKNLTDIEGECAKMNT